jgi:hypothetical protein
MMMTYLHVQNNTSQEAIGRKGRKNCLVIGMRREIIRSVAIDVLTRAPGSSITDKQKIPTTARNKY